MLSQIEKSAKVDNAFTVGDPRDYYNKWAETYDVDVEGEYRGAEHIRPVLLKYLKPADKILIVGVGTGKEAVHLAENGFKHITGLDASEKMLEKAKEWGCFEQLIQEVLEQGKESTLPASSFDAMICVGVFYPGGLDARYLEEIIRPIKTGGKSIVGVREAWTETQHENYPHGLGPEFERLEKEGRLRLVEKSIVPGYRSDGSPGVYFVHAVL